MREEREKREGGGKLHPCGDWSPRPSGTCQLRERVRTEREGGREGVGRESGKETDGNDISDTQMKMIYHECIQTYILHTYNINYINITDIYKLF